MTKKGIFVTLDMESEKQMCDVTKILDAIEQGDTGAAERLLPLVYEELRCLATQKMAQENPGHTLQATALVHEAYIRLVGSNIGSWANRAHFFAAAAEAMRRILIDNARRKQRIKRGADRRRIDINDVDIVVETPSIDLIALDEALSRLVEEDPEVAELVKMRFFAGLTLDQVAAILQISRRTADRNWAYAKAWLYQHITEAR